MKRSKMREREKRQGSERGLMKAGLTVHRHLKGRDLSMELMLKNQRVTIQIYKISIDI